MDVMERKRLKLTAVARMKSGGRFPVDTRLCESYHKVGRKENPTECRVHQNRIGPQMIGQAEKYWVKIACGGTSRGLGKRKKNPLTDGAEPVKGSRLASCNAAAVGLNVTMNYAPQFDFGNQSNGGPFNHSQ